MRFAWPARWARPSPLWAIPEEAKAAVAEAMALADIVKASEEEAELFGAETYAEAAKTFLACGPKLVLITYGSEGSGFYTEKFSGTVPAFKVHTVDTTGAGDNFMGGFLSRFIREGKAPEALTEETLSQMLRYANAAGAICASRFGAIAGQATEDEILEFMNQGKD